MQHTRSRLSVVYMTRQHLPAVEAAESATFVEPWTARDFLAVFRSRNTCAIVVEMGGEAVGHAIYRLRHKSVRLHRLVVAPHARRLGVASALITFLKGRVPGPDGNREFLVCDADEDNLPMQLLLRANGLRCDRILRGHGGPDGYRFTWRRPAGHLTSEDVENCRGK